MPDRGELGLPVAEHMRVHAHEITDLADPEIDLVRDLPDVGRCVFHITKDSLITVCLCRYLVNNKPEMGERPENLEPGRYLFNRSRNRLLGRNETICRLVMVMIRRCAGCDRGAAICRAR